MRKLVNLYKKRHCLTIGYGLIYSLCSCLGAFMIARISRNIIDKSLNVALILLLVYFLLNFITIFLDKKANQSIAIMSKKIGIYLRQEEFKKAYLANEMNLDNQLTKIDLIETKALYAYYHYAHALIVTICGMISLCFISPIFSLFTFITIFTLYMTSKIIEKKVSLLSTQHLESSKTYTDFLNDYIHGIHEIEDPKTSLFFNLKHASLLKEFQNKKRKYLTHESYLVDLYYIPVIIIESIAYGFLGYLVFYQHIDVTKIILFYELYGFTVRFGEDCLRNFISYKAYENSVIPYQKITKIPPYRPIEKMDKITLSHVSFSYHQPIFEDLNLEIKSGHHYYIYEANGSGKTTFFKLLGKMIHLQKGDLYWNQTNYRDIDALAIYEHIAYCSLDSHLFLDNIQDNLPDHPISELDMNQKIETLSGGQKQLVSFYRAFYSDKDILLLDEAFNGIDKHKADELYRLLKNSPKTIIVITHHLSPIIKDYFEKLPLFRK